MTWVTAPAPTVRPPSRMAKRLPSSRATGVMSSTSMLMLSPGMIISTPSGRMQRPGHIGGADVELGPVAIEEGGMPSALLLGQDIDLGGKAGVRLDAARLGQHLPPLHLGPLDPAQEAAHVVAGLALIQGLLEHLHPGAGDRCAAPR